MSADVIKKVILAKQATREICCHCVLTLAWKLEEVVKHMELLKVMKEDFQCAYVEASDEVDFFERLLLSRNRSDLGDDIKFLHQAYKKDHALDTGLAWLDPGYGECTSSMINDITT